MDLKKNVPQKGEILFEEENISTCAVRFYNYTTKLGAQIQ